MLTRGHNILTLDIKSLLNGDDHYVIPVYQRNYAWQEAQINQLIQDIIDYIPKYGPAQDYYIGTLVTYERKKGASFFYETIDGQQRITTLTLLTSVIRHFYNDYDLTWFKKVNLDFESRKTSSDTLHHIYIYGEEFSPGYEWNESIVSGFQLCKELLRKKLLENNLDIQSFAEFLYKNVKILRVTVPEDTDLNHYFEIMNNRGEQLEKHEILKSKFLELLNGLDISERDISLKVFNLIWESCSNMEKYIQYGFVVSQRDAVFGLNDWNTFLPLDFSDLIHKLQNSFIDKDNVASSLSIHSIIQGNTFKLADKQGEDLPDRFNAVINFPNFLLHVLRIYTNKDIPLDDKRLISTFDTEIKAATDKIRFAQEFGYELLRCKFLFDKYIIKREFISGTDRWSLKRLKWYKDNKVSYVNTFGSDDDESNDENRSILMLLSMFHVSAPTLVYKHWLNAALFYLMQRNDFVEASQYKKYLLATVRSFIFDRFLSKSFPKDYFEIIYNNKLTINRDFSNLDLSKLVFQVGIENIVFNYLDFLLWEKYKNRYKRIKEFEFSFRSSVEHYYPRNPMPGYKELNKTSLDSFGNLCLISHSKNSRLSNQPPIAKKSHYNKQTLDSIKQWIMMEEYNPDEWNETSIGDHEQKMIKLLTEELDSDYADVFIIGHDLSRLDSKTWRWFNQYKNDSRQMSLLARAILCFGDISVHVGDTFYNDVRYPKYFMYDWDRIKTSEPFLLFSDFVKKHDPVSLTSVIQFNLDNNTDLENDSYRYVFVKYPEVLDYCTQGYFTWVGDGKQILLHEGVNNNNRTRDLIIHLLTFWFNKKYGVIFDDISREKIRININYLSHENRFNFSTSDDSKGTLIIDRSDLGKIKCYVVPHRNSSSSNFVQSLSLFGWNNIHENYFQRGATATLCVLSNDYDADFNKILERIEIIIKNGLGIKL